MNSRVYLFVAILLISLGNIDQSFATTNESGEESAQNTKNVILLIGDGMGYEHMKLASLVEYGAPGLLHMEQLPYLFNVTTYAADAAITDSAAAGTAIATGHKTNKKME